MKKTNIALVMVIAGLALFISVGVYADYYSIQQLEHDVFIDRERPAAAFPHALHSDDIGLDCMECHHIYENGVNVWEDTEICDCSGCHSVESDGKNLSLMRAFHTNCKGCHLKEGSGPITCGECHPKKK